MSFFTITSSLLSICPKLWWEGEQLHSRSSLKALIPTFFLFYKHVIVCPHEQVITIRRCWLWFIRWTKTIPFNRIERIDYDVSSLSTSWTWFGETADEVDEYKVGVLTHDGRRIKLWSFIGEGSAETGFWGVMMGDSVIDYSGNQGSASLQFAEALCHVTGKTLT